MKNETRQKLKDVLKTLQTPEERTAFLVEEMGNSLNEFRTAFDSEKNKPNIVFEDGILSTIQAIDAYKSAIPKLTQSLKNSYAESTKELVNKLDEVKTHLTPKKDDSAINSLAKEFSGLKDVLSVLMASMLIEMKRLKRDGGGGGSSWNFTRLSGVVDGSNTIFTIPTNQVVPRSDAIILVWNAGEFNQAVEGDYVISGGTFTFTFPPSQAPAVLYTK